MAEGIALNGEEHAPGDTWEKDVAPAGAYIDTARVRSYEVGRTGRIGAGTILRYLEGIATEASASAGFGTRWYERQNTAWVVRDMHLFIGALPRIGEAITLATWVADFKRVQAQREYMIQRADGGRVVARASARWAYIERTRGQPVRLHDEMVGAFRVLGHQMTPRHLAPLAEDDGALTRHELLLTAREYEADTQQHINNCIYADWLNEGLHLAVRSMPGWPANRVPHPRHLHIEYRRSALPGDEIRVSTQVVMRGMRGLRVRQEIASASDGNLYVAARSDYLAAAD